jgi:uncharacterized alpha-E superfamily protein
MGTFQNRAEQMLGRLKAELDYTGVSDIMAVGVHEFVDRIQTRLNVANGAIFETFFDLPELPGSAATASQAQS